MNNSSFNIIGAGAIGHLLACHLIRQNIPAALYNHRVAQSKTIQVITPKQDFTCKIPYYELNHWQDRNTIIICVKAHQLENLCQQLVKLTPQKCPILLMMNGLGLIEIIQRYFPGHPVFHASITHGAYFSRDKLLYTGSGQTLIGNLATLYDKKSILPTIECLNAALPITSWNDTHQLSMHLKLIINAIINPITALHRIKNGQLIRSGQLIQEARELLNELRPLLPFLHPALTISKVNKILKRVILNTQTNTSSMLQDILSNKTTEIDFINGYLCDTASNVSISLKRHSKIIDQIKSLTPPPK